MRNHHNYKRPVERCAASIAQSAIICLCSESIMELCMLPIERCYVAATRRASLHRFLKSTEFLQILLLLVDHPGCESLDGIAVTAFVGEFGHLDAVLMVHLHHPHVRRIVSRLRHVGLSCAVDHDRGRFVVTPHRRRAQVSHQSARLRAS